MRLIAVPIRMAAYPLIFQAVLVLRLLQILGRILKRSIRWRTVHYTVLKMEVKIVSIFTKRSGKNRCKQEMQDF